MQFLVALLVVSAVSVSLANQCCFPKQYSATQGIMKGTVKNGQLSLLQGVLDYWHDGVSKMSVFHERLTIDGINTDIFVLQDFNVTMKKYVVANNHCKVTPMTSYRDGCIPDWAQVVAHSNFSGMNKVMEFKTYNNSAGDVTSYITASAGTTCYPILDASIKPHGSEPYMQVIQFHNFTVGMPDPSMFKIPTICQQAGPVGK